MTGPEFKAALKRHGMTQIQFAREYKVHEVTVSRWARGEVPLPYWAERVMEHSTIFPGWLTEPGTRRER